MRKKKPTPAEAGKGLTIVASYYSVVEKPAENKNKEKPLKNDEIAVLSAGNNNTNDNSTNTNTTTRPEEATIVGPDIAPVDEENESELSKNESKNKEDVESSGDEEEGDDKSEDELTDSAYNAVDDQKSYFNNGTEKVTNMEIDTVTTNGGVLLKNNMDGPDKKAGGKAESNRAPVEETMEPKINKNKNKYKNDIESELNTKTEEATSMGADTEVIGGSGLQKHVERFHEKGATVARTEDNRMMEA